jgi:hypothetical protein
VRGTLCAGVAYTEPAVLRLNGKIDKSEVQEPNECSEDKWGFVPRQFQLHELWDVEQRSIDGYLGWAEWLGGPDVAKNGRHGVPIRQ